MQIKTKVNISLNEIKELIADKYKISTDFDLYIKEMLVCTKDEFQDSPKQADKPWYPDNSGELVEISDSLKHLTESLDCCRIGHISQNTKDNI